MVSLLPPDPPQHLDRYRLVGEIASGGMATVYLARLSGAGGFKRLVAIKQLHPHLASKEEFVQMFLDEARLAAAIHHRNVVPIVEIGNTSAGYYLVMEYVEGVTLSRLAGPEAPTEAAVPRPILLRIVLDALSGLHASHELVGDDGQPLELVHRDCSPQNLLVGLDGCTRLTDFGIARARGRIHHTRAGGAKGKVAYMAPETAQGDPIDRRADLFGMGVVLWESLAARALFEGDHEIEVLENVLRQPIPLLTELEPSVPRALADVCDRALMRDPRSRFATAREMAAAIEAAAEEVGSEHDVESFMQQRFGERAAEQRDLIRRWSRGVGVSPSDRAPSSSPHPPAPRIVQSGGSGSPGPVVESGTSELPALELDLPAKARAPSSPPDDDGSDELAAPPRRGRSEPSSPRPSGPSPAPAFPERSAEPDASREIERAVKAALARRGVGGTVVVRGDVVELHREGGAAPVGIDIGEWVSQWNLLPKEMRDRRAESAAERLQKITGEGKRVRRDADPIERVRARERLQRILTTAFVLAVGGATGWWLWAHGFFGERGPSLPTFGGPDPPETAASAKALEPTGARTRRACDAARERILAGQAMGLDVEGWVVELWLARERDEAGLDGHPALRRVAEQGAAEALGARREGTISLQALELAELAAVTVRLDRGYAVPFFSSEGRERFVAFAVELAETVGASYAGLYARCAHRSTRDVGAWYAAGTKEGALAAMLWTSGASVEPLPALAERIAAVKPDRIDGLLRAVGARERVSGEGSSSSVALRFPLGGANSASKASKELYDALGPR